ncbi:MAG: hypothetical protein GY754_45320 [bacterium]|nr:hypothetical protein [bacterium]
MNTQKYIKYFFLSVFGLIFTSFAATTVYYKVIPYFVLNDMVEKFEDACYSNNLNEFYHVVTKNSSLVKYVNEETESKGINSLFDTFNKFQKGFSVMNIHYNEVDVKNQDGQKETILGNIKKVAKKDGREKILGRITLIKVNEEWKVHQFKFSKSLRI